MMFGRFSQDKEYKNLILGAVMDDLKHKTRLCGGR